MAQPTDPKDQEGVSVWSYEDLIKHQNSRKDQGGFIENENKEGEQDEDEDEDIEMQ